jgi:hypothetical protein
MTKYHDKKLPYSHAAFIVLLSVGKPNTPDRQDQADGLPIEANGG